MLYETLIEDLRHDGRIIAKLGSPIFKVKQAVNMLAAAEAVEKLQRVHQLDQAEIVQLRRQIEAMADLFRMREAKIGIVVEIRKEKTDV